MKQLSLIFTILFILVSCVKYDENCLPYYLYSVSQNSDINYDMISQIDTLPYGRVKLKNEFYPIKGNYTVARFLSFSYGYGHECQAESNSLLILKVDSNHVVVDGFIYPLQWAEVPAKCELYRITKKKKLKNKKTITSLFNSKENPFDINKKGYLVIPQYIDIYRDNILEEKKEKICPVEPDEFVIDLPLDSFY